jgi:all-trans-8'-apo-beta-carotenal 15,15'-oxygenase
VTRSFHSSFAPIPREHGFEPLRVEGRIPDELDGALYRNGPGLFSIFGHGYEHWFDGDGLVSAVRFAGGRAEGASKLVQTPGLREERERGAAYFGSYGTKPPGGFQWRRALRTLREGGKNPANTSMLAWNERLFALCEVGRPTEIDPSTLETIGETDLDGAIVRPFTAHPHRIARTNSFINVGVRIGRPTLLDVVLLRADGTAGRLASIPLASATLIHDFALTERHAIVFVAPLDIALLRVLFGRTSFAGSMSWHAERGTEVIVIPLDAPASPIRFTVPAFWAWHTANAFERDGQIVVDLVRYDSFETTARWIEGVYRGEPSLDPGAYLSRVTIDPKRRTLSSVKLRDHTSEFPRVAPADDAREHASVYHVEHSSAEAGRRGPPDVLARVDVDRGVTDRFAFSSHEWPSEGVFVPRASAKDATDGWLVSLVYDDRSHASAWWIFDAARLADGPLTRAHLTHHVPLGFHGCWRPS